MKGLIVWGTTSNAGKSYIVTGLCRALSNRGLKVAPFKGQNMSNNSFVTISGHEIGRSQGLQAQAARTKATVHMNPVLLKPNGNHKSEVIILGESVGTPAAREYRDTYFSYGREAVRTSLAYLEENYDIVVMEGAGSPAEVNLMNKDLANLTSAEVADVPALLAADIERGGIFASITGTLSLLPSCHRRRVKGLIVNKFRGDPTLFKEGVSWLNKHTGVKVNGVIPSLNISVEEEDSLSLSAIEQKRLSKDTLDLAVISLPYISNYTDLEPFTCEKDVSVRIVKEPSQFGSPDIIILPGTKSTIHACQYLRTNGLLKKIQEHGSTGGFIAGLCGGYQILGEHLIDISGNDSGQRGKETTGAGLLPVRTHFKHHKRTEQWSGHLYAKNKTNIFLQGFEIHNGYTEASYDDDWLPLTVSVNGEYDGLRSSDYRCIGSYVHHLFHNDEWRTFWLNKARERKGLKKREVEPYSQQDDHRLDELADAFEKHLDIDGILEIVEKGM